MDIKYYEVCRHLQAETHVTIYMTKKKAYDLAEHLLKSANNPLNNEGEVSMTLFLKEEADK